MNVLVSLEIPCVYNFPHVFLSTMGEMEVGQEGQNVHSLAKREVVFCT